MERLTWREMVDYWRRSSAVPVNWERDPEGLARVCHIGGPSWLNAHYAQSQRAVFEMLLSRLELELRMPVLDVGCGTGRWSGLLLEHGLAVTGIDIQCDLIERNRQRYPQAVFECKAVQQLEPNRLFDLVTCVTVLQHLPYDEQRKAAQAIRSVLAPGGHLLLLENLRDKAPHVFSNSREGWTELLHESGFRLLAFRRYDYNPTLRAVHWVRQHGRVSLSPLARTPRLPVDNHLLPERSSLPRDLRRAGRRAVSIAQRVALTVDARLEPALVRWNPGRGSGHAGFLLEAR